MKEYHINFFHHDCADDEIIITKDINRRGVDYMDDFENAWKRRYIVEVGDEVVDIFGNIVTVSEVIQHEKTQSHNYLVEENGNCYQPTELAGLYVRKLSKEEFGKIVACGETDIVS